MHTHIDVIHYCSVWLEITQTWLYNQVAYLPDYVGNHVVCRTARNLDQFSRANIHALKTDYYGKYLLTRIVSLFGKQLNVASFKRILKEVKPDVVHSHFGNNGWLLLNQLNRYGSPHFVSFYGQDVSKLPQDDPIWLTRYQALFDAPQSQFLCEGPFMRESLIKLGCDKNKINVHHLGVAVHKIDFQPRQWTSAAPLKVLIVASFREKKGIPYALEALGRVSKDLPLGITIIGDATKSKASIQEKHRIVDTITNWKLGRVTRMLGYQPMSVLWSEARSHHLFLSPSVTARDGDTEGGAPLSLVEMAASGIPIVSSFHCDIPEVIKDGVTGWLAEERNVDQIIKCIYRWIEHPERWGPMLSAGRSHIEKNYNSVSQGNLLAERYQQSLQWR